MTEMSTVVKSLTIAEACEGLESPVYTIGPITRTDIVRYAGAGGDFNPIHHDEEFAKSVGLPSIFSMGLLQGGLVSRLAADWLGLGNLKQLRTRFRGQVWPGEVLKISGRVVKVADLPYGKLVQTELVATNEGGDVKIQGFAEAVLPS